MGLLLSVALSFGTAFFYAVIIYWFDRYEKEPKRLLVGAFVWGAVVAVIGAIVSEVVFEIGVFVFTRSGIAAENLTGSIAAPIVEEGLKGLAVLMVFLIFRSEFDSILDGIVYAGITALGFAAVENVLYIYGFGYLEHGFEGLYALFFMRGILGGWDHPMWTAFTGIGLAAARLTRNTTVKLTAPIGGWIAAVLLHSLHNTLIELFRTFGFLSALLVDWSGWILIFVVMVWAIRREKSWLVKHLRDEVDRRTITADQYRIACSSLAQYGARLRALFRRRYQVTRRFYRATADLAFKKEQLQYDDEREDNAILERMRAELVKLSPLALT